EMTEEQQREIDAMNLSGMLTDALGDGQNVDFNEVSFILGRLSALEKPELVPIVLNNLERLAPVAKSVAAFFKESLSKLSLLVVGRMQDGTGRRFCQRSLGSC